MARRKDLTARISNEFLILEIAGQFFVVRVEQASFANLCQRNNVFIIRFTSSRLLQLPNFGVNTLVILEMGAPSLYATAQPLTETCSVQFAPQFSANHKFHSTGLNPVEEILSC